MPNPLSQYFRQPSIYIKLPSRGQNYPAGTLNMPANGELPVYPMTAIDEITYRTPDALFNGQATVNVIQSCVPNIRDAWAVPSIDLDTILIAIRIASYGHNMDFDSTCPHCRAEHTYTMDLRAMMDSVRCPDYDQPYETAGLKILFRPQAYYDVNRTNKTSFELTKMQQALDALTDQADPEGLAKMSAISTGIQKVSELTHQFAMSHTAPRIVVGTPASQLHELGAIMAAATAASLGWHPIYLGPSLPAHEIAGAALRNDAAAVALSIVYPEDDPNLARELTDLARLLPASTRILAGGRAARGYLETLVRIGALYADNIEEFGTQLDSLRRSVAKRGTA